MKLLRMFEPASPDAVYALIVDGQVMAKAVIDERAIMDRAATLDVAMKVTDELVRKSGESRHDIANMVIAAIQEEQHREMMSRPWPRHSKPELRPEPLMTATELEDQGFWKKLFDGLGEALLKQDDLPKARVIKIGDADG